MATTVRFNLRPHRRSAGIVLLGLTIAAGTSACRSSGRAEGRGPAGQAIIRRVACVYDQNPWLDLDRLGDRDVEGLWFRVFLDPGSGRGVHAEGTLHVEMYRVDRKRDGQGAAVRTLVSDWHYATSDFARIAKPGMLGDGYVPQFVWAEKSLAGSDVDVVIWFEDTDGNIARAGTKRLSIPKYDR